MRTTPPDVYAVAVAIIRDGMDVLMVRQRANGPAGAFVWSLPGGKCELGESFADAAIRETREETGLVPYGAPVLAYACSYKNAREGFSARVMAYAFPAFTGRLGENLAPAIAEAAFLPLRDALERLAQLDGPMVCEPAIACLTDAAASNMHWDYAAGRDGVYRRTRPPQGIADVTTLFSPPAA